LPDHGSTPQFLQLYICDTANEIQNRVRCLDPANELIETLDPIVVEELMMILDQHNQFPEKIRMARDRLADYEH
jgi:hypothetical protein